MLTLHDLAGRPVAKIDGLIGRADTTQTLRWLEAAIKTLHTDEQNKITDEFNVLSGESFRCAGCGRIPDIDEVAECPKPYCSVECLNENDPLAEIELECPDCGRWFDGLPVDVGTVCGRCRRGIVQFRS